MYCTVYLGHELAFSQRPYYYGQVVEMNKEQASKHETAVDDFRRWNEEAVSRCVLFTPQVFAYSFTSVFVNNGYFNEVVMSSRQL